MLQTNFLTETNLYLLSMYPTTVQWLPLHWWVRNILRPGWWPYLHSSIFLACRSILAVVLQGISREPGEFAKCGRDLFSVWMDFVTLHSAFDLFHLPLQSHNMTDMLVRETSWPFLGELHRYLIQRQMKSRIEPHSGCLQENYGKIECSTYHSTPETSQLRQM